MPITKTIIDALETCKVITLGSVGVDSVDVKAATARGIPVTNIPDTFIEEMADHAMMLLLAGFRRLVIALPQDEGEEGVLRGLDRAAALVGKFA